MQRNSFELVEEPCDQDGNVGLRVYLNDQVLGYTVYKNGRIYSKLNMGVLL